MTIKSQSQSDNQTDIFLKECLNDTEMSKHVWNSKIKMSALIIFYDA